MVFVSKEKEGNLRFIFGYAIYSTIEKIKRPSLLI